MLMKIIKCMVKLFDENTSIDFIFLLYILGEIGVFTDVYNRKGLFLSVFLVYEKVYILSKTIIFLLNNIFFYYIIISE